MFKKIFAVLTALMVLFAAAGCSEADKVNHNISQQAEYFQSERRVTVWNARTDNVIHVHRGIYQHQQQQHRRTGRYGKGRRGQLQGELRVFKRLHPVRC